MKNIAAIIAIAISSLLTGCLAVTGQLGYTSPNTGVTYGLNIGKKDSQPPNPNQPLELPATKGLEK